MVAWFPPTTGFLRYLAVLPLMFLGLGSVAGLGFGFSCFPMKPATATVVSLGIVLLDSVLWNIPYFASLRPWFLTTRWLAWHQVFADPLPWSELFREAGFLTLLSAAGFLGGRWIFLRREVTP